MGSPITFSGFNSIDWNQILEAVMAQERQPVARLETQKSTLESQRTAFGTLLTRLTTLQAAIDKLASANSFNPARATSSSPSIDVSASSAATPGAYDIVVSTLARAQVMASSSTYASLDAIVATAGSLTIASAEGAPVDITIEGPTTLSGLASAINAATHGAATAAVVQTSPGSYQLVLTGRATGTSNAFTVSHTLTGGEGLAFTDTDGNGTAGDSLADLVQEARNALLTVNGLPVESASNIVAGVVPGATMTLRKQDASETVSVAVGRDADAAVSLVQAFINAYNDIVQFVKDQDAAALAGRPNLARDPLLRSFRDNFRAALQGSYNEDGTFTQLAQIGVGFDRTGKLTLDRAVLNAAVSASAADVQALLSGTDGKGGVFGALRSTVTEYTRAGGLVGTARDRLTTQVRGITSRLDALEARLAVRRQALQKEYLQADRLMSQLQAQATSLSQLGTQFRSL